MEINLSADLVSGGGASARLARARAIDEAAFDQAHSKRQTTLLDIDRAALEEKDHLEALAKRIGERVRERLEISRELDEERINVRNAALVVELEDAREALLREQEDKLANRPANDNDNVNNNGNEHAEDGSPEGEAAALLLEEDPGRTGSPFEDVVELEEIIVPLSFGITSPTTGESKFGILGINSGAKSAAESSNPLIVTTADLNREGEQRNDRLAQISQAYQLRQDDVIANRDTVHENTLLRRDEATATATAGARSVERGQREGFGSLIDLFA